MDIAPDPQPIRTGPTASIHYAEIPCENCGRYFSFGGPRFMEHFVGSPLPPCETCSQPIDLWNAARSVVRWNTAHFLKLALVGAATSFLSVYLKPGETATVDLDTLGIPGDSHLLDVTYSEANGFRPVEVHTTSQPRRQKLPRHYLLHALPDDTQTCENEDFLITVTWMPAHAEPTPTPIYALVEAMHRFCLDDLELVPILAHAANEQGARALASNVLSKFLPPERAAEFARSAPVRDVYQVLLPLAAQTARVLPLDPYVAGLVEGLRKDRNPRAHGTPVPTPDRQLLADQLTASVFLLNYLHYVSEALDRPAEYYPADHPLARAIRATFFSEHHTETTPSDQPAP